MHHGDFYICHLLGAAFVHLRQMIDALLRKPATEFWDSYNLGIVLLRQFDGIADVIAVSVGNEHDVEGLQGSF